MAYKGQRAPTSCDNGNEHSLPWYHPTFIVTAAFSTYMLVFMMASKIDSMRNPKGGKKYWLTRNQASRVIAVFVIYSMFPLLHLCMLEVLYFQFGIYGFLFSITAIDTIRFIRGIGAIFSSGVSTKEGDEKTPVIFTDTKQTRLLEAEDTYQDFGKNISHAILMFMLQFGLTSVYVVSIVEGGRPCFQESRVYVYYLLGLFTKAIYTMSTDTQNYDKLLYQLTHFRDFNWWEDAATKLRISENKSFYNGISSDANDLKEGINQFRVINFWIRFVLSFIVNTFIFDVLYVVVNIEMANSRDGVEFVLNFVAALAITEYDNMNYRTPKAITVEILPKDLWGDSQSDETFEQHP